MGSAPWDNVPSKDTFFALVTGTNSGIGFSIGQRLIDEYLASRSLSSHLVLIPTTRSTQKSADTVTALRKYVKLLAETGSKLRSRGGQDYDPRSVTRRVHILSVQLDLCDLLSVYAAAQLLVHGTLRLAYQKDDPDWAPSVEVAIPRLDAVILNAGMGGWQGVSWVGIVHNILTKGLVQAATWPTYKGGVAGLMCKPLPSGKREDAGKDSESENPQLGEVFCANVFGHYVFVHYLMPLLRRPASSTLPVGRIIWESSVEPVWDCLSLDDFQAVRTPAAYESTKRLTDVLALTSSLPSTRPFVDRYLDTDVATQQPPRIYLVHPGVVHTTLFPLHALFYYPLRLMLYLVRWLGSPWHQVTGYNGACAPVWLALQPQDALDAAQAERVKWGSSTDRMGKCHVKKTEVEGWGWEGFVEDRKALLKDSATSVLRKTVGRKSGAVDLTDERRKEFEHVGVRCWMEMEKLRMEWKERLEKIATCT